MSTSRQLFEVSASVHHILWGVQRNIKDRDDFPMERAILPSESRQPMRASQIGTSDVFNNGSSPSFFAATSLIL